MSDADLRQAVLDAIAGVAPDAEVEFAALNPDKGLREQLDLDSMDFLNVIIALHESLKVDIPEKDYPRLLTLNGAVAYLAQKTDG
jgi:acyl carrier protein